MFPHQVTTRNFPAVAITQAYKESGAGRRRVWRRGYGKTHTFHTITESFAERESGRAMDQARWDLWLDAMGQTIKGRELTTSRSVLAIQTTKRTNFIAVTQRTIRAVKVSEYPEWLGIKLIPAKKNGSNGMVWERGLYEGDNKNITTGRVINSWGDSDKLLLEPFR
ncbi:MAG: hypothetical protein CBC35_03975 [Planctomycetes bacterium TMED75]|nr:MAG: hypothetical protein CBC35_03975 [Planctomycetes bacterium TMED75]